VTLGRQAKRENVLLSPDELARRGIDCIAIERGGDVTYHGPGQLVVYPILKLERFREVVPLVRALEGAVIDACARFGIAGERWSSHAGVWVGRNQICAVGLAIQRMVSLHGLALNVSTELEYDRLINPCGLRDRGITSVSAETGRPVRIDDAKQVLLEELARSFDINFSSSGQQLVEA
jgi:lipoyl(octanoyl) transferase